ncbi:twitching motility protein PilT [Fusibacter ferrireducens]|uniref:Twitching motility protein PilT n=1 Tax=Fusibacter ferrireducens TaxID=2785058 RepID=A0ABR9ZZ09_9FIRM|nr:twitching motility protein PilT [Fusibacter ferrireducens]MBF4695698.1 twitching motility protein PilT [Fusibacter ferrireducens]
MVTLIAGKKGTGKSKEIVKMANEIVAEVNGDAIFIDDDNRAMYNLHHDLRFVNMKEFPIDTGEEFLGFICGLISNNYDIQKIFIDGILNCVTIELDRLPAWFKKIEDISTAFSVDFIITLNYESALPESLQRFMR